MSNDNKKRETNPNWKQETITIQGGYNPESGDPRIAPIAQSTTFYYDSVQEVADLFDLKAPGHMYTRISNPTTEVFETKMAALEGGVGALAVSAGQTASMISIFNITSSGQHVVAASNLYGGTHALFHNTLPKMGIEVTFVDQSASTEEIKKAFKENTRCFFAETLTNPSTDVLDIEKMAEIAHSAGVPLIVDNTFPTPFLCQPLKFGADIIVHSATKYIDGHATSVGGVIIDGGKFDWSKDNKYPEITEANESYHGLVFLDTFGKAAYIAKARTHLLRDMGTALSPFNAFLFNLGLETLHIRMERHCDNAQKLAEFLESHPNVAWVKYPGLKSDPNHTLSKKYLKGNSGVLSFGVKGGRDAGEKVMDAVKLAAIVVHVADLRTCVLHPASMTHRQLSDSALADAGVKPDLIRVSVGLEHIDDIIEDFDQALKSI